VLVFRGTRLTETEHVAFATRFGKVHYPPVPTKHGGPPEINVLDQVNPAGDGADMWHNDNTYTAVPPMASMLKAVRVPSVGGDTCFASMYAAYEALSGPMRAFVDGLDAVHDITKVMRKAIDAGHTTLDLAEMQRRCPAVTHPVAKVHPETGRRALFVNRNSTSHLVGVTERENEVLLPFLFDHVRSPAFQCRFHWEPDSVAFWDNRSVQHFAVPDYDEPRVMHRVTIAGPTAR
jgi:taurine dioxygenase